MSQLDDLGAILDLEHLNQLKPLRKLSTFSNHTKIFSRYNFAKLKTKRPLQVERSVKTRECLSKCHGFANAQGAMGHGNDDGLSKIIRHIKEHTC